MPKENNPQIRDLFCHIESVANIHCQLTGFVTVHLLNFLSFHGGTIHDISQRLLFDFMPMFPTNTGNTYCDSDEISQNYWRGKQERAD
jgi:hypothetical protein